MAAFDPKGPPASSGTMMLLDSNILIYAALGADDVVIEFVKENAPLVSDITRVEVLGFQGITLAEIEYLNAFFSSTTPIPVTEDIIRQAIDLRRQRKINLGDALIAATALTHKLSLVTRNTRDFKWIDSLDLIDPFNT